MSNELPLTGFSKISYQEFLGIFEVIKTYESLNSEEREMIDLIMIGMKTREETK